MQTYQDYSKAPDKTKWLQTALQEYVNGAEYKKAQMEAEYMAGRDTAIIETVKVIYDMLGRAMTDFTAANNPYIADEIERINRKFLDADKNYVLIGPGRWGSSDYWLGIPVKWPHISAARVIVEEGLKNYHVDPSQGTHFFQNLTSFGVGYFTINTYTGDGVLQRDVLDAMPAVEETEYVRHVRFDRPLKIMMDGKKQHGVVLLPET